MIRIDDLILEGFPVLLAPMEDITDPPFRALCRRYGASLIMVTHDLDLLHYAQHTYQMRDGYIEKQR